jgi:hypothetical protein
MELPVVEEIKINVARTNMIIHLKQIWNRKRQVSSSLCKNKILTAELRRVDRCFAIRWFLLVALHVMFMVDKMTVRGFCFSLSVSF